MQITNGRKAALEQEASCTAGSNGARQTESTHRPAFRQPAHRQASPRTGVHLVQVRPLVHVRYAYKRALRTSLTSICVPVGFKKP